MQPTTAESSPYFLFSLLSHLISPHQIQNAAIQVHTATLWVSQPDNSPSPLRYPGCWVPARLSTCNKSDSLGESWAKSHMSALGNLPPRQVCSAAPNTLIGLQRSRQI